jgi:Zn-dependent protease with chaperone function
VPARPAPTFAEYVAARKGQAATRVRESAAYAFAGDLTLRTRLAKLPPVSMAVSSALRFWEGPGKARVIGESVRVTDRQFPHLDMLLARCVRLLQIPRPTLFVAPHAIGFDARTLGTPDEATIVVSGAILDKLDEVETLAMLGRECGHVHNEHVAFHTALYFMETAGNVALRVAAQPAVLALRRWSRRADITCDRAAALVTHDLAPAASAAVKLAIGSRGLADLEVGVAALMTELEQGTPGRADELVRQEPLLPKRLQALRVFAETTYWKSVVGGPGGAASPGITREECDAKVAELLGA